MRAETFQRFKKKTVLKKKVKKKRKKQIMSFRFPFRRCFFFLLFASKLLTVEHRGLTSPGLKDSNRYVYTSFTRRFNTLFTRLHDVFLLSFDNFSTQFLKYNIGLGSVGSRFNNTDSVKKYIFFSRLYKLSLLFNSPEKCAVRADRNEG